MSNTAPTLFQAFRTARMAFSGKHENKVVIMYGSDEIIHAQAVRLK